MVLYLIKLLVAVIILFTELVMLNEKVYIKKY